MNKSLELFIAEANPQGVNSQIVEATADDVFMPCAMQALLINCQSDALPGVERELAGARNFSWHNVSYADATSQQQSGRTHYDILLLLLPHDEAQAVEALSYAASYGIATILLGQDTSQGVLRRAFQQGVCDFISLDAPKGQLLEAISHIASQVAKKAKLAPLIAVINGKGGSGASFIATSLADIVAARASDEVALIDSDLHCGTLAHMLGLNPSFYITDALLSLEQLDAVALKSVMTKKNQLHLLAAQSFSLLNSQVNIEPDQFKQLLLKCRKHYRQVIIDLSRGPEQWNLSVLEDAEILLVLQQNVISIRETKALITQLVGNLGLDRQRIHILVNRYQKRGVDISISDIKEATGIDSVWTVGNDFKVANQCTDLGVAITGVVRRGRMLSDLQKIASNFLPPSPAANKATSSIWSRLFGA
ncbi:MAG: P-loop NTPase [Gammaproteobacteria bacterium]|nr:P-loop NTPase [Gammaproteobacteria bacterium]